MLGCFIVQKNPLKGRLTEPVNTKDYFPPNSCVCLHCGGGGTPKMWWCSVGGQQHTPGLGGWILGWLFLVSVLKKSGGGSSPRSILHSKAYKHWMYCFFSELAALLDVPTFRLVASSLHFLFLLTWWATEEDGGGDSKIHTTFLEELACSSVVKKL